MAVSLLPSLACLGPARGSLGLCCCSASVGPGGSREEGAPVSPALVPSAATSLQNGCEEAEGAGAGGVCPEAGDGEGGDCDQVWL